VPLIARWPYAQLDPQLRKSFEVALHAGAGLALALELREELLEEVLHPDRLRLLVIALSLAPPALAGLTLHGVIERRLGGPRSIAAGLVAGSLAMAAAELRRAPGTRERRDARAGDGLALGFAQTAALMPGISRSGAALTATRVRGFTRAGSQELSWHAALGVILGASLLTGARLARSSPPPEARAALVTGAGAAFLSTHASAARLRRGESRRSLLGFCVYRCLLASMVIRRLRAEEEGVE
jgi:undecaprenyl-diphosphatase